MGNVNMKERLTRTIFCFDRSVGETFRFFSYLQIIINILYNLFRHLFMIESF